MSEMPDMSPRDEWNEALLANVHPADWTNPEPSRRYNLVVIGAGTAGLITSAVAAGLGARVGLVERHLLGGDCLNVGCVPSKTLIRASRMIAEARRAEAFGLPPVDDSRIDFDAVMRRVRQVRARISRDDSARRYRDELGVDVFLGGGRFRDRGSIEVDGAILNFKKAVIATGARASLPPISGLADSGALTNETLFGLTRRPARFGVIGAGPIGCEMAQAFRRLGSAVTLFDQSPRVLPRDDADAAAIVQQRLAAEGIELALGCRIESVARRGDLRVVRAACGVEDVREHAFDEILVAVGRAANVDGLGLEAAGIDFDPARGVVVSDTLQTSNRNVFAAGDVCMAWKFTHAADAAAKIAVQNALFLPTARLSTLVMPWCTYTDPEVAQVGLSEREARERGIAVDVYEIPLEEVNRAVTDGDANGFLKILTKQGRDEIVGATLVAANAGDMISEITVAMVGGVGLAGIMKAIHPYPTQAEVIKRAAGAYTRTRLTPWAKKAIGSWLALSR